jgi:hypothetical protein
MAAPIGNQFWKLRSKHGRDRLFETPELMEEAINEYFQWCIDNPFYKSEAKTVNIGDYQSEIKIAELPVMRPFTIQGLCGYLDCNVVYFNQFEASLSGKTDELSKGFSKVITRARDVIYRQKFEGAASGFFNANIIARDLGLKDESNVNVNDNRKATSDLFPLDESGKTE